MRNPFESVRVVSATDPALAMTEAELAQYRESYDESLVKCHPGAKPCWFTVKRISSVFAIEVLEAREVQTRAILAFCAGVHEIELPNGDKLKAPIIEGSRNRLAEVDAWIGTAAERVGPRRVQEIGLVAARLAMLDGDAFDPLSLAPGRAQTS